MWDRGIAYIRENSQILKNIWIPSFVKKKHTHRGFATSPQIKRYKCIMLDMKSLYLILSQFDSTYQNSIKMLVVTLPFPYFFFNFILFRIFIKHEVSFFTFFPYKPKLEQTWKKKIVQRDKISQITLNLIHDLKGGTTAYSWPQLGKKKKNPRLAPSWSQIMHMLKALYHLYIWAPL